MNLLLLLSALLSALTGVGGHARAPQAAATVRVAQEAAVEAAVAIAGERPTVALPGLASVAQAPLDELSRGIAREPIFAGRRRE